MASRVLPPVLLAGAASVLLAFELAEPPATGAPVRLPPFGTRTASTATVPPGDAGGELRVILARPLFSSGRRPPTSGPATATANAAPRLSAILVGGGMRRAVFENGDKPVAVGVGGHAGPYTVIAIDTTSVAVGGTDGTHRLRPTPLPASDANTNGAGATNATTAPAPFTGVSLLDQLRRGALPSNRMSPMQQLLQRVHRNG